MVFPPAPALCVKAFLGYNGPANRVVVSPGEGFGGHLFGRGTPALCRLWWSPVVATRCLLCGICVVGGFCVSWVVVLIVMLLLFGDGVRVRESRRLYAATGLVELMMWRQGPHWFCVVDSLPLL